MSDTVDELEEKVNASVQHQKEIIQLQQNTLSLHQEALTLQEKAVCLQTSQSEAYKEFADQLKTVNKEFILSFGEIQKEIGDTYSGIHADFAETVFQTQLKFNDNMKVPEEIFKSITSILDRFKGFEESLNAFGKAQVDQNTGMLKLIREQIERLTNVNTTIITYLDEFEKRRWLPGRYS
ncbi:MAG: hypothetical protein LIP01_00315 [Tannerellaceae bacterium]|nr:hypothetical protein [Tannerellaceae bacterium]